jgi:hypothetical protein
VERGEHYSRTVSSSHRSIPFLQTAVPVTALKLVDRHSLSFGGLHKTKLRLGLREAAVKAAITRLCGNVTAIHLDYLEVRLGARRGRVKGERQQPLLREKHAQQPFVTFPLADTFLIPLLQVAGLVHFADAAQAKSCMSQHVSVPDDTPALANSTSVPLSFSQVRATVTSVS